MTPMGKLGYLTYWSNRTQQGEIDYNKAIKTLKEIKAIRMEWKMLATDQSRGKRIDHFVSSACTSVGKRRCMLKKKRQKKEKDECELSFPLWAVTPFLVDFFLHCYSQQNTNEEVHQNKRKKNYTIKPIGCYQRELLARSITNPVLIDATGSLNGFTQCHVTAWSFFGDINKQNSLQIQYESCN